jgi:hypothetical protein
MSLDGRIETRLPLTIQVNLVSTHAADAVLTENVSSRGARVVTKRRWQPGEHQWITPVSGKFHLQARVVYCQPVSNDSFHVGLALQDSFASWWDGS